MTAGSYALSISPLMLFFLLAQFYIGH